MIGMIFDKIYEDSYADLKFEGSQTVKMYHSQSCCEHVAVVKRSGLENLIGSPILTAEAYASNLPPEDYADNDDDDGWKPESETWTLFKFMTAKGAAEILWHGTSNGYYGEGVDLELESK